ncbi:Sin3 histone deacetylase corepressor complex component SDS3 [Araneus ventricosus]|uniref:Sin3 histone deacetylase corepressor complex component SDS3 n=1 Tax=Araneus ventricosus TaxID=182803 RepID=A0A4Y2NDG3_ARAVE|nr:Sin3 histone deacetylase corepressor complex component SDS3 [Araneus ventricosus]
MCLLAARSILRRQLTISLPLSLSRANMSAIIASNLRSGDRNIYLIDTEDASETARINDEEAYSEIKDQIYRDKSADLKNQLKQLENRTHPLYVKGVKLLKEEYVERQFKNEIFYAVEVERIKREHEIERETAYNEFDQKEKELKENLIADLEEKRKIIEAERDSMDVTTDTMDILQNPIRKLRRRAKDTSPAPEPKRRKTSISQQLKFQLTEDEINEDLRKINEVSAERSSKVNDNSEESSSEISNSSDIRVENGKLYYEKYWYGSLFKS